MKGQKFLSDSEKMTAILQFLQTDIANFAIKYGIPKSHLYNLSGGKINQFSQETRIKLLEGIPNLDPRWLITGDGPMFLTPSQSFNITSSPQSTINTGEMKVEIPVGIVELLNSQQETIKKLTSVVENLSHL